MRAKLYICIFCICLGLMGCSSKDTSVQINTPDTIQPVTIESVAVPTPSPEATPTPAPTPSPTPEPPKEIQLMMVGDNLMHMGIVRTGEQEDGSYNYDILFEGIQPFLAEAEIKMINQETILGGTEKGFSGYPYFNSPTEVGDAIVEAGFNVVLHASNHAADKGVDGLKSCLEYWQQYPKMLVSGIHEKDVSPIQILTIEGIDFAILNYTYGPNLEVIPDSIEPHLDMLCNYNEANQLDFTTLNPQVLKDIEMAEQMADIVIVCPHWGTEYTTKQSSYQKKFAKQMVEAGADIIIGTHPHVVQPVEWIESDNGNRALCYYSLGNYVSSQKQALCMLEAMAWITFEITENGAVLKADETGVIPLVCHYSAMPVRFERVYLLEDYTDELAAVHGIKAYGGVDLILNDLQTWTQDVFGENVLSLEQILE